MNDLDTCQRSWPRTSSSQPIDKNYCRVQSTRLSTGARSTPDTENYTHRVLLGRLAREYRIPAICWFSDSVEAGALIFYDHDLKALARRLGAQIVEILNGGNPAEMPIFQETQYELVINLKAAKELGLEIPPGLVARADRVIE